jgi:hypothetical protein
MPDNSQVASAVIEAIPVYVVTLAPVSTRQPKEFSMKPDTLACLTARTAAHRIAIAIEKPTMHRDVSVFVVNYRDSTDCPTTTPQRNLDHAASS